MICLYSLPFAVYNFLFAFSFLDARLRLGTRVEPLRVPRRRSDSSAEASEGGSTPSAAASARISGVEAIRAF